MSSIVEISAATLSVNCDANGAAQHVVNVHNISGRKQRVGARIITDGDTKSQWLGAIAAQGKEGQHEWDLEADQTIQLIVPVAASDAAPGKYTFRVEVYSTDAPSEHFTTGDGLAIEVSEPKSGPTPTVKPFPWAIVVVSVLVGLLVLGGGGWAIYNALSYTHVPDLSDQSIDDARKMIEENGLQVGMVTAKDGSETPEGPVVDQTPDPDEKVKKGTPVDLVTASGSSTPVPNLTGKSLDEAKQLIEANELKIGTVTARDGNDMPDGPVVEQTPAPDEKVTKGSTVDLVTASGSSTQVPNLTGKSLDEAKRMIVTNELRVGTVTSKHEGNKPKNTVIGQTPAAERKIRKGSIVDLVTESGPPVVTPPKVHKQGRFNVRQTWSGDLDNGVESSNGADFKFQAVTGTERYLAPSNGAKLVRMGNRLLSYSDCAGANFGTARISLQTLPAGTRLCAMTSEGRVSTFRVENNVGPISGVLTVSFTTWEKKLPIIIKPQLDTRVLNIPR